MVHCGRTHTKPSERVHKRAGEYPCEYGLEFGLCVLVYSFVCTHVSAAVTVSSQCVCVCARVYGSREVKDTV